MSVGLIENIMASLTPMASRMDGTTPPVAPLHQLIIISLVSLKDITLHVVGLDMRPILVHALSTVAHLNPNKL